MKEILIALCAYLFGSVPWALVIGKVFYGVDIRTKGSGNLGGSNAGRVLGKKAGISVTLLDIGKAVLAVYLGSLVSLNLGALCGLLVAIGHIYPIFANFKGGKAVATAIGFLFSTSFFLGVTYWLPLGAVIVFIVLLKLFKMVALSSIMAFIFASIYAIFLPVDIIIKATIWTLTLIIIVRHRANISRIINHNENKVTWL
ncbi:MAG: glycerol-3-phosphate 1-O-acyltransferase PlsY [Erysipelotrichaceae bacterium]